MKHLKTLTFGVAVVALAACGGAKNENTAGDTSAAATTPAPATTPATTPVAGDSAALSTPGTDTTKRADSVTKRP